jgi:uncharacterized protein
LGLNHSLRVADVPPSGLDLRLVATPEERAALARANGLPDLAAIEADLRIERSASGGLRVTGRLRAEVTYACVVTLEPFPGRLDEAVAIRFEPPAARAEAEVDVDPAGDDPPEPLADGRAQFGSVLAEHVAVALDPYPRAPGAVFEPPDPPSDGRQGPFARLSALKPR